MGHHLSMYTAQSLQRPVLLVPGQGGRVRAGQEDQRTEIRAVSRNAEIWSQTSTWRRGNRVSFDLGRPVGSGDVVDGHREAGEEGRLGWGDGVHSGPRCWNHTLWVTPAEVGRREDQGAGSWTRPGYCARLPEGITDLGVGTVRTGWKAPGLGKHPQLGDEVGKETVNQAMKPKDNEEAGDGVRNEIRTNKDLGENRRARDHPKAIRQDKKIPVDFI